MSERQPRVAVLSHAFWQQRFGGSAATIGQAFTINGEPFADPIAFGAAMLVLMITGIAAIYFPARRASALNPVDPLRLE